MPGARWLSPPRPGPCLPRLLPVAADGGQVPAAPRTAPASFWGWGHCGGLPVAHRPLPPALPMLYHFMPASLPGSRSGFLFSFFLASNN